MGSGQWAVGSRQWAVGSGQWAVGSRQWAVGRRQWAAILPGRLIQNPESIIQNRPSPARGGIK